jgi:hypothetical protein
MQNEEAPKLLYQARNSFVSYIPAILFLVAAFVSFFNHFPVAVTGALAAFYLLGMYRQNFGILVYEDRFVLHEDFMPGNFMRVERKFDYASISNFECNFNYKPYRIKDLIGLLTMSVLFPAVRWNKNYFTVPEIEIRIEFKDLPEKQKTQLIKIRFPKKRFLKGLTVVRENVFGGPGPWEE